MSDYTSLVGRVECSAPLECGTAYGDGVGDEVIADTVSELVVECCKVESVVTGPDGM